jgi:signal peptidase I
VTRRQRLPIVSIGICLVAMACFAALEIDFWPSIRVLLSGHRIGRTFYIPSESMLPTLQVDDRIIPRRISADELRRGMIIVFSTPAGTRVDRIIGLPGDIVALDRGMIKINGRPVFQHPTGVAIAGPENDPTIALKERLPGEGHDHRILQAGETPLDDMAPVTIAPAHLFVLGDNRDRAADSRVPVAEGGVGMVPVGSVIGQVDTVMWAHDRARIGGPIDSAVTAEHRA